MASETPCHGERPICGHPECRECIEYAHDAVRAPRMTPADRLAEAVRKVRAIYQHPCESPCEHDICEVWRALSAYDARKKPTVEEVAEVIRDTLPPYPDPIEDAEWNEAARAAMRVMGEEP